MKYSKNMCVFLWCMKKKQKLLSIWQLAWFAGMYCVIFGKKHDTE